MMPDGLKLKEQVLSIRRFYFYRKKYFQMAYGSLAPKIAHFGVWTGEGAESRGIKSDFCLVKVMKTVGVRLVYV